jgi:hypothetical protein
MWKVSYIYGAPLTNPAADAGEPFGNGLLSVQSGWAVMRNGMGILNDPHESRRQTDRQIDSGINVDENKPTTTASALCLVLVVVGVIYIQTSGMGAGI